MFPTLEEWMEPELRTLGRQPYELLVIGGGVYGLSLAWQAALAGVETALVEASHFGSGVSRNSLRIVHGGLRYLQHLDLPRFRQSVLDRREWLRIAPGIVRPLQCLAPVAESGVRSRLPFRTALVLNDLLSADRNAGLPLCQQLPRSRLVPLPAPLRRWVPQKHAASWWDARIADDDSLAMALAASAEAAGATLRCQTIATSVRGASPLEVVLRDARSGSEGTLAAKLVVDTTGKAGEALRRSAGIPDRQLSWVLALNLRFAIEWPGTAALALRGVEGARADGRVRDFFCTPEPDGFSFGTSYVEAMPGADDQETLDRGISQALQEAARIVPEATQDRLQEVTWGWLPATSSLRRRDAGSPSARLLARVAWIDGGCHGLPGFVSLCGVKLTTALSETQRLLARLGTPLGRTIGYRVQRPVLVPPPSR